jgi:hypothetical protein
MRTARIVGLVLFATIFVVGLGYFGVRQYLSRPDRLVSRLQEQLRGGDFDRLYTESSDFMKLNTGREDFSRRLRVMSDHLREYDSEITLVRDLETETRLDKVFATTDTPDPAISVVLKVDNVEDVYVYATWMDGWLEPKLFNVSIQDFREGRHMTLAGNPFDQALTK